MSTYALNNINYSYVVGSGIATVASASATGAVTVLSSFVVNNVTYNVTSIGASAFQNRSSITSVAIPASVTSIGSQAFNNCSGLTSITFAENSLLTIIDYNAFTWCNMLISIVIPNSVTTINNFAFQNCRALTGVTFGANSLLTTIGSNVFEGCTSMTSFTFPSLITSVGNYTLSGCTLLTHVILNSFVPSLGTVMFGVRNANFQITFNYVGTIATGMCYGFTTLATVNIGSSITSIGTQAFYGCTSLSSITISSSVTSIGTQAFKGCTSLSSVTIGSSVTSIGLEAFQGCTSLPSITIPNTVTSIGNNAFYGCTNIISVTFTPTSSVSTIGSNAFYSCGISSITIPASVTSISSGAFYNCINLVNIVVKTTASIAGTMSSNTGQSITIDYAGAISTSAYSGLIKLANITIGSNITSIGINAFYGCTALTSVNIPNSVTTILAQAFFNCSVLTTVTFSENSSLTLIGNRAFARCSLLGNVVIPNSVTTIDSYAFFYCIGMQGITLPNAITTINSYIFSNCTGLTTINIPNTVLTIGDGAFNTCTSLTTITIPASVTSIGSSAFYGCTNITSIVVESSNPNFLSDQNGVLFNKDKTMLISYPTKSTNASYDIPSSVTTIQPYSFSKCTSLTNVTIPASITTIGNYVFEACNLLLTVTFLGSIPTIGTNNFIATNDTAVYTVNSVINTDSAVVLSKLTMFTNYLTTTGKINPQTGVLNLPNKSMSDSTYTIINPTIPIDNSGTWSYETSDVGNVSISGNIITFIASGFVQIIATLSSDSIYNSKVIIGQFSISEANVAPSSFVFTTSNTILDIIPPTVQPVLNVVTLSSTIFTPENLELLNPTAGTDIEKSNNRNMVVDTLFSIFPTASTIIVPPTAIYLPGAITQDGLTTVKLIKTIGTTSQIPLLINANVLDQTTAFFCNFDEYGNAIACNGAGTYVGYIVKIIKEIGNGYTVIRTDSQGVSTTSSAVKGDVIFYAGFKLVLGSITGQLSNPPATLTDFSVPEKTFGTAPFTITDPSSNSLGAFTYTSSNTSVASVAGNVVTIVGTGSSTITAVQASTVNYISTLINATLVVSQATTTLANFSIPAKTCGIAPFTITDPSSNSTGAFTYTSSNTSAATIAGNVVTIIGVGSSTITANQASTTNYTSGTITATLVVSQGTPTITFSIPAKVTRIDPFTIDPSSNSTGSFTYSSSTPSVATVAGNVVTIIGVGSSTITANQASTTNYTSRTITATLVVTLPTPTITFSIPAKIVGIAPFTITAPTSNSTGAFTYTSSNLSVATIAGNKITIVGIGTSTITVVQAGTALYVSGTITTPLTVSLPAPTIAKMTIPAKVFGNAPFSITAPTSNSTGAFTYTSSNTSVATVAGNVVTIVGAGTSTITAAKASTTNYTSGSITEQLIVSKATPVLTSFSVPNKNIGDAPFSITDPSSNSTGAFTYTSSATSVATVAGNVVTIVGIGSAIITASQATTTNYTIKTITATFVVTLPSPTLIDFSVPAKTVGNAPFTITAPTSNINSTFTYTSSNTAVAKITGNVVTIVGVGSSIITAVQVGNTTYKSGTITSTLAVSQGTPTITNFTIPAKIVGNAPFALTAPRSNSTGAITYTSSDLSVATVLGKMVTIVGNGTSTITASQAGTVNYASGSITAPIVVTLPLPTIAKMTIPAKTFGIAPFSIIDPSSNSTGAFTYTSSNTSVLTISGNVVTIIGGGTSTITAVQASTAIYASRTITTPLKVNQKVPTITSFSIPTKIIGTAPFTITDPSSNSSGAFTYTSAKLSVATVAGNVVTIVGIGSSVITASQAPTTNYIAGKITATFVVNLPAPTITDFSVPAKTVGNAPFAIIAPTSNSIGAFTYTSMTPSVATITGNVVTIVGTGSSIIRAVQAGNASYASGTITSTLVVSQGTPILTVFSIPAKIVGNAPFAITAPRSTSTGAITYTSSNTSVVTVAGNMITIVGNGSSTITAEQASTTNYISGTITAPIVVTLPLPTIAKMTIPAKVFGNAPFSITAPTSNSTGAFTYTSSNTSVATVAGNVVTIVGAGTSTITAVQASTAIYASLSITTPLTVSKATPVVTNFSIPNKTVGSAPFSITDPTSNSSGAFTYTSSKLTVATVSGNVVTIVGAGSAIITANQAITSNYIAGKITATLVVGL